MESRIYEEEMSDDASTSSEEHISNNTGSTMENNDLNDAILPNTHSGEGLSLQLGGTTPITDNQIRNNGDTDEIHQHREIFEIPSSIKITANRDNPLTLTIKGAADGFDALKIKVTVLEVECYGSMVESDSRSSMSHDQAAVNDSGDNVFLCVQSLNISGQSHQTKHVTPPVQKTTENNSSRQNGHELKNLTGADLNGNGTTYLKYGGEGLVLKAISLENKGLDHIDVQIEIFDSEETMDSNSDNKEKKTKTISPRTLVLRFQLLKWVGEGLESISNFLDIKWIDPRDKNEKHDIYVRGFLSEDFSDNTVESDSTESESDDDILLNSPPGLRRSTNKRESSPEVRKNKKSKTE